MTSTQGRGSAFTVWLPLGRRPQLDDRPHQNRAPGTSPRGPSSPAATTHGELVHGFRAVAYGRRHYRQGVEYADVAVELEPQMLRLDTLQHAFLEAANPQLHGKRGSPR